MSHVAKRNCLRGLFGPGLALARPHATAQDSKRLETSDLESTGILSM